MTDSIRVLHVDDDPDFADLTADFLERTDDRFEITSEHRPAAALDRIVEDRESIDCIVSDYQMPEMDGIEFLRSVRERFPDVPIPFVLLTGKGDEEIAAKALNAGASSYLQKGGPDVYAHLAERIRHDIRAARAERARDRFDTLVRALEDPVYVLNENGEFTYVNDAFVDLVGYDRNTIVGSGPSLIKSAEAVERAEDHLARILSVDGPESVTFEVDIQPRDGEPIPCEDHMGVLPYETDMFRGSLGVLRDISRRKERERSLQEAKERYQLLVEQNLVGLYIARDDELIYHNAPFADLFGYSDEENALAGASMHTLVKPADRERLSENLTEIQSREGESFRQPYIATTRDGETVNAEILGRGINLSGQPAVIGTVVDVEKDEAQYWELRRERDRLEEFTSIISHDLRNPLNVAKSSIELAQTADRDGSGADLERANNALDRMEELLADLLTLARQGKTIDDPEAIGLSGIAESTWENVATREATLDLTATGTIWADPSRVKGLFENLYRNAVEHAGPDVTVRVGGLEEGFYVEDDGPGIPGDERDTVFESGYTTTSDGTGFGLAIVSEIVDAHGWQITLTESPAGGARFEIRSDERAVRQDGPG